MAAYSEVWNPENVESCLEQPLERGFLYSSVGKASAHNTGNLGSVPGWRLEKEMAAHSSILACRLPWTEEPGKLQFTGSQELDTT